MGAAGSIAALLGGADIASFAATIYTAALLATVPVAAAGVATILLRRAGAEARSLMWRSAIVALLVLFIGRQQPLHWIAVVVPSTLAAPLVALGRARMMVSIAPSATSAMPTDATVGATGAISVVRALMVIYGIGVLGVLLPVLVGMSRARRRMASATPVSDPALMSILEETCRVTGVRRPVRLYVDADAAVPVTWGVLRPVIVLPPIAGEWTIAQMRIVLLHELGHVRAADWAFKIAARVGCALYWFHPGAWWIARGLRDDCELACDERVIATGVRRSDYAELLVTAAERLHLDARATAAALALSERGGLRARLVAVLDARGATRPLRRGWTVVAATVTLALVCPASTVRLAPTRDVLTNLMRDTRWESRAYAVLGLAQRADSIAEARTAAEADPSPRVRAWARYALGETHQRPDVQPIIREY